MNVNLEKSIYIEKTSLEISCLLAVLDVNGLSVRRNLQCTETLFERV